MNNMKLFLKKNWFICLAFFIVAVGFFLRLYGLDKVPPSPYWEEAALGYDAYSILKTGKDHHGNSWPLLAFESFGDWKPSLYFYLMVPFIQIFGLTVLAVRLPSALLGASLVPILGYLAFKLSDGLLPLKKPSLQNKYSFTLLAMAFAAFNPWLIQFSRGGWEVNAATTFFTLGITLFIAFTQNSKRIILIFASVISLILSMYTYHALRLIAPVVGVALVIYWFYLENSRSTINAAKAWFLKQSKLFGILFIVAFLALVPFLLNFNSPTLTQRLAETSIFSDLTIIEQSNVLKELSGNSLFSRIFYHRYVLFGKEVLQNMVSHFNLAYLFLHGDSNPRHSIQYFGLFYPTDVLFLLVGLFIALKKRSKVWTLLVFILLIGLLPASISTGSPHALRMLPTALFFILTLAVGAYQSYKLFITGFSFKKYKTLGIASASIILALIYAGQFVAYQRTYGLIYPKQHSHEWQFGYKEAISQVNVFESNNPGKTVYITREKGRPAMYYWFFSKTDPKQVQTADQTAKMDQGEFLEFENKHFINSVSEVTDKSAFILSSPEQYEQFILQHPLATVGKNFSISDLGNKEVWIGYTYVME